MNNPKVKLSLLISVLAALGAVITAFAAGSHFQIGYNYVRFNFVFKVAVGESGAASVLGMIALAAGVIGVGLYVSRGGHAGGEPAAVPGAAAPSGFSDFAGALRRLTKSRTDEWLGGVCGGLGEHTPLPSWVWRLVFLVLLFCYGTGVLLYLLFWLCLPEPPKQEEKPFTPSGTAASTAE